MSDEMFKVNYSGTYSPYSDISSETFGQIWASAGTNGTFDCYIDPSATDYLFITRTDDDLLYKLISDVKGGDELTFSDSDLKPFEKTVAFNLPSSAETASMLFRGFKGAYINKAGFFLDEFYNMNVVGKTSITSGYLPSITNFITDLTINYNGGKSANFCKVGSLPSSITWPDISRYSIGKLEPTSLSVTGNGDVQYIMASWQIVTSGKFNELYIYSPQLAPNVGSVPDEMLQAHPDFSLTGVNYEQSSITFYVSGSTYENFSSGYVGGSLGDRELTSVTIRVQN